MPQTFAEYRPRRPHLRLMPQGPAMQAVAAEGIDISSTVPQIVTRSVSASKHSSQIFWAEIAGLTRCRATAPGAEAARGGPAEEPGRLAPSIRHCAGSANLPP